MNIIVGVSGGIAAYKSCEVVRLLKKQDHHVRVVMTKAAQQFVTPMTFQALSGKPVHTDLFDITQEQAMGHIELGRWADKIIIVPASANCLAQLAHGFADNLLMTICLVTTAPIYLAPAMNQMMWENIATQENAEVLMQRGYHLLGPDSGEQACGEVGLGRMLEPEKIVADLFEETHETIQKSIADSMKKSAGTVLITAGPTQEALDPVRVISNRSSGKMGYALAAAFEAADWTVRLISGPTAQVAPKNVHVTVVESTDDMLTAVLAAVEEADIFISAAAVCDYKPKYFSQEKMKKKTDSLEIVLEPTIDILKTVSERFPHLFKVGFALETESLAENALKKLQAKHLNLIVANTVSDALGLSHATVSLFASDKTVQCLGPLPKVQLAAQLTQSILKQFLLKQRINKECSYENTIENIR